MAVKKVKFKIVAEATIDTKKGTVIIEYGDGPSIPVSKHATMQLNFETSRVYEIPPKLLAAS